MKRIYGVKVCLQFARGAWHCHKMRRLRWSIGVLVVSDTRIKLWYQLCEDLKKDQLTAECMGEFLVVFSMADRGSEGA